MKTPKITDSLIKEINRSKVAKEKLTARITMLKLRLQDACKHPVSRREASTTLGVWVCTVCGLRKAVGYD